MKKPAQGGSEDPEEDDQTEAERNDPNASEDEAEQESEEEEKDDDDDEEPQDAELTVYTDAWDTTGWGIEPVLKKLEQDFGVSFDLTYDLLNPRELDEESWWQAATRYEMPSTEVDSLPEDTRLSTQALEAAQEQDQALYRGYMRRLRIAALVEGRNIEDREILLNLAEEVGLDTDQIADNWTSQEETTEYDDTPEMVAVVGDHLVTWDGNLDYVIAFGFLIDNNVVPVGGHPTFAEFVSEYEPVTTTEVVGAFDISPDQARSELQDREIIDSLRYGDTNFWMMS